MFDFFRAVPKKRSVKIKSKEGVIFSNPSGLKKNLFYIGTIFFIWSSGYLCYLYWPLTKSFVTYKIGKKTVVMENEIKQEMTEPKIIIEEFIIKIPKIGAEAEVKKYISPYNKDEYLPILNEDMVAHSKNSNLPNEGKTIYLFAHSSKQGVQASRNNAVFYLLGKLDNNDLIFLQYNGEIYEYMVYGKKVVSADEIEYMKYQEEGKEILVLQTCWPIGTDWKRLLIFAERK